MQEKWPRPTRRSVRCSQPILDQRARCADTLVVLTSDHGESLGEHGEATHGIFAYEATLKVPLILYYPPLLAPRIVDAAVSHVDILPTILEALGLPAPPGLRGRSLLPVATARERPGRSPTSKRSRDRSIAAGRRCRESSRTDRSTSTSRSPSCTTFTRIQAKRTTWPTSDRRRSLACRRCCGRSEGRRPARRRNGRSQRAAAEPRIRHVNRSRIEALHGRRRSQAADPGRGRASGGRPSLSGRPGQRRALACPRTDSRASRQPLGFAAARPSRARRGKHAAGDCRAAAGRDHRSGRCRGRLSARCHLTAANRPRDAIELLQPYASRLMRTCRCSSPSRWRRRAACLSRSASRRSKKRACRTGRTP